MRELSLSRLKVTVIGIAAVIFCFGVFMCPVRAQAVSSRELINGAKDYDGKVVLYKGEVIGEIMRRGAFAWINIYDGEAAIGVWAPVDLLKDISISGGYGRKGDIVEVSGIFNRSCTEHGGDLDIHARQIIRISEGRRIQEGIDSRKARFALSLVFILGIVWILSLLSRHWIRRQPR